MESSDTDSIISGQDSIVLDLPDHDDAILVSNEDRAIVSSDDDDDDDDDDDNDAIISAEEEPDTLAGSQKHAKRGEEEGQKEGILKGATDKQAFATQEAGEPLPSRARDSTKRSREHTSVVTEEDVGVPSSRLEESVSDDSDWGGSTVLKVHHPDRARSHIRVPQDLDRSESLPHSRHRMSSEGMARETSDSMKPTIGRDTQARKLGQPPDLLVTKDGFLRVPAPTAELEAPSLDIEKSSSSQRDMRRSPAHDEPAFVESVRDPSPRVTKSSSDAVQPGDPDFRRSFAQEQAQNRDEPMKCVLYMKDVFSDFLLSEMEDNAHFWDLVVLTGYTGETWLTTCGDYVTATWPRNANMIQGVFAILGRNDSGAGPERLSLSSSTGEMTVSTFRDSLAPKKLDDLNYSLTLDGISEPQADVVEAVTWLFSVLQQDPEGDIPGPYASVSRWNKRRGQKRGGASRYELTLDYLEPLFVHYTEACWTNLVPRTACATCYCTKKRPQSMHGVEISFDLLCFMAGLEYEVVENGGLILYGKYALVYPVGQELGNVQWHLQPYNVCQPITYQIEGKRLLVDDLDALRDQPRHFLGLWSDPRITLGTRSSECLTVDWSDAKELDVETTRDGMTIGGAVAVPKVLTFTWTQTYKVARSRRNQYMVNFEADLHRMINSPVILYSPSEKRGWMVSFVSVLLHLTRIRAEMQKDLGFHIPACELQGNGGQAAFDCLRACYREPLKKAFRNEVLSDEEQRITVEDYVKDVRAAMEVARREGCRAKGFLHQIRDRIIGFELADIARMKPQLRMKQHSLGTFATSGWAPLLDSVELTFFYDGVSDPIIPSETSAFRGYCGKSTWQSIPKGFNLLSVSLPCLLHLAEDRNGGQSKIQRLTQDFYWHSPGRLFGDCERQKRHSCSRLQELAKIGQARSPDVLVRNPMETRAVVFRYAHGFRAIVEQERKNRVGQVVVYRNVRASQAADRGTPDSGFVSQESQRTSADTLSTQPGLKTRRRKPATKVTTRKISAPDEVKGSDSVRSPPSTKGKDTKPATTPQRRTTGSSRGGLGWLLS